VSESTASTPSVPSTPPAGGPTRGGLHALAVVLSSLVIPLPLLAGRLVEAVLDTANPADVDVAAELAYLREILGWSFGALGALLVAIVVVFALVYRRARTLDALKLPLLVLGLQIVLGALILVLNGIVDAAEG